MINIGLVGVGYFGEIHLNNLKKIPEFNIVGFYDNNKKRSNEISKKFNIQAFNNVSELLSKIDAVNIVTPTINHYEYCIQAIDEGKHIFVEKPLSESYNKALEIEKKILNKNIKLQIGHIERFNPAYTYAKKFINNPIYIESHRLTEFKKRGHDISVVLDLMIHDIDIILTIVKSDIKKINAKGMKVTNNNIDIANVIIEFKNGCIANITSSRVAAKNIRMMKITQKNEHITMDFLNKKSKIEFIKNKLETKVKKSHNIKNNQIKDELISFKNAIIKNQNTLINIKDACKSLKTAHQILKIINNV